MTVQMELSRIFIREMTEMQIIELTEVDGERTFPIVIGLGEASEIRRVLHGESTPRPLTHQLAQSLIDSLDASLSGVDIIDLRDNTFYAELVLTDGGGEEVRVDSRPSDALALGLRAGCQLRVAESVLEQVRMDQAASDSDPDPDPGPDPDPDPDSDLGLGGIHPTEP